VSEIKEETDAKCYLDSSFTCRYESTPSSGALGIMWPREKLMVLRVCDPSLTQSLPNLAGPGYHWCSYLHLYKRDWKGTESIESQRNRIQDQLMRDQLASCPVTRLGLCWNQN
jgi:hypothetical protein